MAELTDALSVAARRALRLPVLLPQSSCTLRRPCLGSVLQAGWYRWSGTAGYPTLLRGASSTVGPWRSWDCWFGLCACSRKRARLHGGRGSGDRGQDQRMGAPLTGAWQVLLAIVGACAALVAAVLVGIILLGSLSVRFR
jgi:hypothetical protein